MRQAYINVSSQQCLCTTINLLFFIIPLLVRITTQFASIRSTTPYKDLY